MSRRRKIEVVAPDAPPMDTIEIQTTAEGDPEPEYLTLRVWHRAGPWAVTSRWSWRKVGGTAHGKSSAMLLDPTFALTYAPSGQRCCLAASVATVAPIADVFAELVPGPLPPDYVAVLTTALGERGAFMAERKPTSRELYGDGGYWVGPLIENWKRTPKRKAGRK